MKKIITICFFSFVSMSLFSQVLITDKTVLNLEPSAVLKLDSDVKGMLLPRVALISDQDVSTIANPQNGNIVFNINPSVNLPETITYYELGKWLSLYTKEQVVPRMDLVGLSSLSSIGNIIITGVKPGVFSLGSGTTDWTPLNIEDNKTISRTKNSLAFTIEGMTQIGSGVNVFYDYAIGVFVNDKLAVVRKYHKNASSYSCVWHKFILNGVVKDLPVGTHNIKVMARNISISPNTTVKDIVYGGIATRENTTTKCPNMSDFMSTISLNTTLVETLN